MTVALSPELTRLVQSGVSILVGTRDASFTPESLRAVGARVEPGGSQVTIFVPEAIGARTFANVAENGRIAVCFCEIATHRTIQIKGRVVEQRPAEEAERGVVECYRRSFAEALAHVGLPRRVTFRIAHWPARALRIALETCFAQTPGPGAGERLELRSAGGAR